MCWTEEIFVVGISTMDCVCVCVLIAFAYGLGVRVFSNQRWVLSYINHN